jgi:uncharacterized RDD family membrane protein YckC
MNDTVRAEVHTKISTGRVATAAARAPMPESRPLPQPPPVLPPAAPRKTVTANLASQKTSKTLVAFQNKNASLPDWRMQLHNAVQQRKGGSGATMAVAAAQPVSESQKNAAPATLQTAPSDVEIAVTTSDARVANAMRRITESRNTFFEPQPKPVKPAQARLFDVVLPNENSSAAAPAKARVLEKPRLVIPPAAAPKRDTNKLPPIETPSAPLPVSLKSVVHSPAESQEKTDSGPRARVSSQLSRIHIQSINAEIETADTAIDGIEDLAPFSMRFGAGLFDLIIGGFATMLVLSPLAFTSANWFTATGLLTFAAAFALISFIYFSAGLGFYGKTVGMRLFQLELVDALENEYPTIRQAAVNSAIFLISLTFAGAGFLTVFFNEEKRALHDLMSGTIIVREF